MKKIAITGMGIVSSIGNSIDAFRHSLYNGVSGVKTISENRFSTQHKVYRNHQACILDDETYNTIADADPTMLVEASAMAIRQAITDAGIEHLMSDKKNRNIGLSVGTSVGSNFPFLRWIKQTLTDPEQVSPMLTPPTIAGSIAKIFKLNGPLSTVSTACAAGTNSIGRACDFIRDGRAEYMIAGGVDIFTDHTFSGFNSLLAVSRNLCSPFDKNRDGLMLGDAAAYVVLEELDHAIARGATIHGEILNYSTLNEAYHPTAPTPDGSMALRVMREAVTYSGLVPEDITYINAHGTATKANDEMEFKALTGFATQHSVYTSSSKSMFGHTLGAAGSIELIATVIGLEHNFIPPTINSTDYGEFEKQTAVNFVKDKALDHTYTYALSNSFGFAGNMASIVLKKWNN